MNLKRKKQSSDICMENMADVIVHMTHVIKLIIQKIEELELLIIESDNQEVSEQNDFNEYKKLFTSLLKSRK